MNSIKTVIVFIGNDKRDDRIPSDCPECGCPDAEFGDGGYSCPNENCPNYDPYFHDDDEKDRD